MLGSLADLPKRMVQKKIIWKANPISSAWAQLELPKCFDQTAIHMTCRCGIYMPKGDDSKLLDVKNTLSFVAKNNHTFMVSFLFLESCLEINVSIFAHLRGNWYNNKI